MLGSNRDEAHRCIELAEKFIGEEKYDKAEKFLAKAEKLFPTQKAKELLERVKSNASAEHGEEAEQVRKRRAAPAPPSPKARTEVDYSSEQIEAVRRLKKCSDYYEILGITKEATDSDIKRAYKKLALQLHPDKNKAPGAVEAFKAIGNAVAILTDPEKRKQYDMYGSDETKIQNSRPNRNNYSENNYSRGFESDITAEELFNMFFGGFPQQNVYVRRNGGWNRQRENHQHMQQAREQNGYTVILQMLPILLLIMLSMMSSFFISDPIYNLSPTQKFSVERKTVTLKVPYYVKENFHSEYQGSLRRLEATVEEEYITNMRHACYREKNYRESMVWKARNFGDKELFQKAQSIKMPSCEILHNLQNPNNLH